MRLDRFFRPRSVAVIGATEKEGSVGRAIAANLQQTPFGGALYLVNPKRGSVLGTHCYSTIAAIGAPIDLAVIVIPAQHVPQAVRDCVAAGVKAAIIISAGFKETGSAGLAAEQEILAEARRGGMRIVGPNCLGIMCPPSGLNATFAASMARPGHLGLISQSGAICTAILDWSQRENVGFSAFVSVGSMIDVEWGDLIQYLGDDPQTRSIIVYMESVPDARKFLSAAREVALTKPIIVLKPGRTEAAAHAAASHTGALAGSDDVMEAAFRRCGVLRVNTIAELFNLAEVLDKQPRLRGPKLTMVSNAGGAIVLATDALLAEGGQLNEISADTKAQLDAVLPPHWSHQNPIDILGDASAERYQKAVEIAARDPGTDGLLVILAPQAMTDPLTVAQKVAEIGRGLKKPLLASWMGGRDVAAGDALLNEARIPTFAYPDAAARAWQSMWRYSTNLEALYETPEASVESEGAAQRAASIVDDARARGRTLLTEAESKNLLAAYGIPTVPTVIASSPDDAVKAAREFGYPVVVKLHSETITHKTDVGGVRLNLPDDDAVRRAFDEIARAVPAAAFQGVTVQPMAKLSGYELILGSSLDPQFGPVLLFGGGGQLVEVYKDRAIGLPPWTTTLAHRVMERTTIYKALLGVRGRKPVDLDALEQLMVRFSFLVVEQPWIREIDINPLLASGDGLLALDARVILHGPEVTAPPRLAIRPYPRQYARPFDMPDGSTLQIRPIRPEDEPRMVRFHERLSDRSVYLRYFHMLGLAERVSHTRLSRMCFIDYDREIALVALEGDEIVAVGRLSKSATANEAELAALVVDEYQGRGLGTELWRRLIEVARAEGLQRVRAEMLAENKNMIEICRLLGFSITSTEDDTLRAELALV